MVGGTSSSAGASANAGVGDGSVEIGGSVEVSGVGICLVNIGVDVGCVVMGAVFVPGLLRCACKGSCPTIEGCKMGPPQVEMSEANGRKS